MFIDQVDIEVRAGSGGHGAVAFLREKFMPQGGPAGGDGGRGGDVVLRASERVNTLQDFRRRRILKAERGKDGGPKKKHGKRGRDLIVDVPVGTLVFDAETGALLGDLQKPGEKLTLAKGGRGGHGNARFATPTQRTPRHAESGQPGEVKKIRLELKLLADVGLLGFPSVGKSTLIRKVSQAKPKVDAYHFTTLIPHLGVVDWKDHQSFVMADIPGIIEGAHRGKGLGHQFLKHLERTRILLHLIEVRPTLDGLGDYRQAIEDFKILVKELKNYEVSLLKRQHVVVLNKIDLWVNREARPYLESYFKSKGLAFFAISGATGQGVEALIDALGKRIFKPDHKLG